MRVNSLAFCINVKCNALRKTQRKTSSSERSFIGSFVDVGGSKNDPSASAALVTFLFWLNSTQFVDVCDGLTDLAKKISHPSWEIRSETK